MWTVLRYCDWLSRHGSGVPVIILSGGDPLFTTVAERIGEAANLYIRTVVQSFSLGEFREVLRGAPVTEKRVA